MRTQYNRICQQCGRPFVCHVKRQKYCSQRCNGDSRTRNPIERFWEKVDTSGDCWLWVGTVDDLGRGQFTVNRRHIRASRFSWQLHHGVIPTGLSVCHRCDNPRCVRPEHLFLGTHLDNMRDMVAKDRSKKWSSCCGERQHSSKLTADEVREIRLLYSNGSFSQRRLAKMFNVTFPNIQSIVTRKTWKHVQ